MGWSKRQFVTAAYEEIGLAGYVFTLQPEQLQAAVKRLDAMCSTWNASGIRLGYPMADNPKYSNLDDATDVPDSANEAIYLNLAIKISPMHGKQVPPDLRISAKKAYTDLLTKNITAYEMSLGYMPAGAGRKSVTDNFLPEAPNRLAAGNDNFIEFSGNDALDGEDLDNDTD